MPYKFLEDVAIADVAFEATGKTLRELFESAGFAVTNTMVEDLNSIKQNVEKNFKIKADTVEMLLFNFLQELIFYKDSELLLFNKFELDVIPEKKSWELNVKAYGEKLDTQRHESLVDVKAVTFHNFEVKETKEGWVARVILDV